MVLQTLTPAERLAFVLHDMFAVPFEDVARVLDRTPAAARQLASRARRRVESRTAAPEPDRGRLRKAVDAFLEASRRGDFDALVAVLDPDVVLRSDGGTARPALNLVLRGGRTVAGRATMFGAFAQLSHPVLVNGPPGFLVADERGPISVMAFTVSAGKITAIDVLADPERLGRLDLQTLIDRFQG